MTDYVAPPGLDPSWEKETFTRLKNLCQWGVVEHRVRDNGGVLLTLTCVKQRTARFADRDDPEVAALIDLLRELVSENRRMSWAKLLWIVLALEVEDPNLDLNAEQRRGLAGREFRGGRNTVGAGSIRKHQEPKAIRILADLVIGREVAARDGAG